MKKPCILLIFLTALLAACSALADGVPSAANESSNRMVIVNPNVSDRLNLRQDPDAASPSFGKYYTGTVVEVDTESTPAGWAYVHIGAEWGYMKKEYLVPYTASAAAQYASALPVATVSNKGGSGVNLRSSPDSGRSVIRLAKNGTSFPVLGITANGFLCLKDGEQVVYALSTMFSPVITFDKNSAKAETAVNPNLMIVVNPDPMDRLNLRESADGKAPSFGKYYTGAVVSVQNTTGDGWAAVTIGSESGFMDMKYLVAYTSEAAQKYAAMLPKATVNNAGGTGLNLRNYATTGSKVLKTIPNGQTLTVLGVTANGWACVQAGDSTGYVQADKLLPAITFAK